MLFRNTPNVFVITLMRLRHQIRIMSLSKYMCRGMHLCVFTRICLFVSLCVCVFECEREKDRVMGRQRERGDMQLNITRVSEGQYLGVCRVCWLCEVGYAHMVYTQPPELRV